MSIVVHNQARLHRWVLWFMARRLAKQIGLKKYVLSGSYRRGKWWCNDIDLLVPVSSQSEADGIMDLLVKQGWNYMPGRDGDSDVVFSTQFYKDTSRGMLVLDLFLSMPGTWGNCLLFTTGPKSFNDKIRSYLHSVGYSWSNPRYFTKIRNNHELSFATEESAMSFLNMKWVTPNKRS